MALLIPNQPLKGDFDGYLVSIQKIQESTGLDFLSDLPDPDEKALESATAAHLWN